MENENNASNKNRLILGIVIVVLIVGLSILGAILYLNRNNNSSISGNKNSEDNNKETIYRWSSDGWAYNEDLTSLKEGTDFVRNKSKVTDMDSRASKYFLKYHIANNKVTDEYVCFVITKAMAKKNPGMKAGEYCLLAGDEKAFLDNSKIIYDIFGPYCEEKPDTNEFSYFDCGVASELYVQLRDDGRVFARDYHGQCSTNYNGTSWCYDY